MASLSEKAQSGIALEGEIVHDHYEIQSQIAKGGMAWLFKAQNTLLQEPVAIKVLYPQFAEEGEIRTRFLGEAKIQFRLKHAHIIQVLDVISEGHLCGMVMEWVDGIDLGAYLKKQKRALSLHQIWKLMRPVLEALHFAHENGVIHRDLKPSNILLHEAKGELTPKLCDFGIAKVEGTLGGHKLLTLPGSMMGTPSYMAPEQIEAAEKVDRRADIYSLGILLYKMSTGRLPFRGGSPMGILQKHLSQPPIPLRKVNPALPEAFERLVMCCLEKDPARRYSDCQTLAFGLTTLLSQSGVGRQAETTPLQFEVMEQMMKAQLQQAAPAPEAAHGNELELELESHEPTTPVGMAFKRPPPPTRETPASPQAAAPSDDDLMALPTGVASHPDLLPSSSSRQREPRSPQRHTPRSGREPSQEAPPPRRRTALTLLLIACCLLLVGALSVMLWKRGGASPAAVCQEGATKPCYNGPASQKGIGRCTTGSQTCRGNQWSACVGQGFPQAEVCNGKDDDCDGKVDEALSRACKTSCGPGTSQCQGGTWKACAANDAPTEICNGKDDNCDGQVDESFPQQGNPCQRRWGQCFAQGTFSCHPTKHKVYCLVTKSVAKQGHSKYVIELRPKGVAFALRLGRRSLRAKDKLCLSLKRNSKLELNAPGYQRCFVTLKANRRGGKVWLKPQGKAPPFADYCRRP